MQIRLLPQNLVNRIAAGEVIERPASALKELVENSLDADASEIIIHIENGGRNLISVTDNGSGMTRPDLELAVERHATSKLDDDDLIKITHFGFRGEALPSIGSISRLKITSRSKNSDSGWQISVEAGEKSLSKPASANVGTTVEIRDLFFATPARLKFLKSERTEQQHIIETLNRIAMANPKTGFTLYADGREILKYKAGQADLLEERLPRLAAVIGKEFADNSTRLDATRENIGLAGYIGLPTFNRATSLNQYFFVNGRPVKDRLFFGAVKAAYQDFIGHGRFPVVTLFLQVPPEEVDVNVHPAKSEVRFRDARLISSTIISAIKNALASSGFRASNTVSDNAISKLAANISGGNTGNYYYPGQPSGGTSDGFSSGRMNNFFAPLPAQGRFNSETLMPSSAFAAELPPLDVDMLDFPLGAARCQLHETYIVAQTSKGIVIVDQHAAHERIVYEKMKESLKSEAIKTQKLLLPEVVELDSGDILRLENEIPELAKFGLVIEKFGTDAVVCHEIPAVLKDFDIKKMIKDLADDLSETGQLLSLKGAIEHVCGTIACHGSIRAGRRLNVDEMNALLREMEATPNTGQCNHGRPTYIELKLSDIESLFGRK